MEHVKNQNWMNKFIGNNKKIIMQLCKVTNYLCLCTNVSFQLTIESCCNTVQYNTSTVYWCIADVAHSTAMTEWNIAQTLNSQWTSHLSQVSMGVPIIGILEKIEPVIMGLCTITFLLKEVYVMVIIIIYPAIKIRDYAGFIQLSAHLSVHIYIHLSIRIQKDIQCIPFVHDLTSRII